MAQRLLLETHGAHHALYGNITGTIFPPLFVFSHALLMLLGLALFAICFVLLFVVIHSLPQLEPLALIAVLPDKMFHSVCLLVLKE